MRLIPMFNKVGGKLGGDDPGVLTYSAFAKAIGAARAGNAVLSNLVDVLDLSPTYVSDPSCKDALRGIFFGLFTPEAPTVTLHEFATFVNGWAGKEGGEGMGWVVKGRRWGRVYEGVLRGEARRGEARRGAP